MEVVILWDVMGLSLLYTSNHGFINYNLLIGLTSQGDYPALPYYTGA